MKTSYLIISIAICAIVASYVSIIASTLGPEDVFNPASIVYFPGVVAQLVANEGNGIICVDACGPCSSYGAFYVLVNGTCVLSKDKPQIDTVTLEKIPEPESESNPRDIDVMARGQLQAERFLGEKTVKVEGKMAKEICAVIGGECPSFYPGNIQDDGSIMVGFAISEKEKTKHYQFFIKNDALSYDEAIIENED